MGEKSVHQNELGLKDNLFVSLVPNKTLKLTQLRNKGYLVVITHKK